MSGFLISLYHRVVIVIQLVNNDLHTDKELFSMVAEGDERAFGQLFEQYAQLLYPYLFSIVKSSWLAEEFFQETMLKLWIHRDRLPEIQNPRSWIFRIATNLAFTYLQRKLVEGKVVDHIKTALPEMQAEVEDALSLKKLKECIKDAVQQLPGQRRLIYQMSRESGLSRAEIAQQLKVSEKTVKNSLNAALRFIREYLRKQGYLVPLLYLLLPG